MQKTERIYPAAAFARVNVIGASGSGKSTIAKKLAEMLRHPYIELDALYWGPNWRHSTDDEVFPRLASALNQSTWVLDGNYDRTLPIKWANVTAVVWIDYSFSRNFIQAFKRAVIRIVTQKELWPGTGNRESFSRTFLSRESILLWMLKTHGKLRERYEARMHDSRYSHVTFARLRNPSEADRFLRQVSLSLQTSHLAQSVISHEEN